VIQGGEWIVIVLVALIVFGPERLPEMARKASGYVREMREAAREMREGLEAEIAEVSKAKSELTDPVSEVKKAVRETAQLAKEANPRRIAWNGPKPLSGPTPADAMADLEKIEQNGEALVDEPEALPSPRSEPGLGA
jgi:sec-independent protein translocase protein TatB